MKRKRFLSALAIGALVGAMTLGTTNQSKAQTDIKINNSGSGSNTWIYGYSNNAYLYTKNSSDVSPDDYSDRYQYWAGHGDKNDRLYMTGGHLETTGDNNTYIYASGGDITVSSGTLDMYYKSGDGFSNSYISEAVNLTVKSGANLKIAASGASVTLNSGTSTSGDRINGTINLSSGTLNLNGGTYFGSGSTINATGGSLNLSGNNSLNSNTVIGSSVNFAVTGGTQTFANAGSIGTAFSNAGIVELQSGTLGKNITGSGSVKISAGTGTVYNNATISQNVNVDTGTFFNNANHEVGGTTSINTGASATNAGTMAAVTNSGTFTNQGSGTTGAITNNKTLSITGGTVASVNNADSTNSVATQSGGTVTGNVTNAGTYTLSGSGQISGTVENSGTFNLKNDKVSDYKQSTGTLNISGNSGVLTLTSTTNTITGGVVNIGSNNGTPTDTSDDTTGKLVINNGITTNQKATVTTVGASELDIQNGKLQTLTGTAIAEAAKVTIGSASNNGAIQHTTGQLTLDDTNDTWNTNGTVTVDGGSLSLKGVTQNGTFNQTSGTTNIGADQTLTTNTSITGGNLNINNGNLTVNGTNAVIGTGATINLVSGKTLNVQNTKTTAVTDGITFDASDTWAGTINQTGGLLTLSGRTGASADSTDSNQKLTMTNGTLVLDGSSLTLNSGSYIQGGTVKIDPSTLIVDNGVDNHSVVNMEDDGSIFTIKGDDSTHITTYTLDDGSTIKDAGTVTVGDATEKFANKLTLSGDTLGSKIQKEVIMVINENAIVDMTGTKSELTINGTGTNKDVWNGIINQTAGTLTFLDDIVKNPTTAKLTSNGGNIEIGYVNTLDPTKNNAGKLTLNNGSDSITSATAVAIKSNGTLDQSAGTVVLDNTNDTWNGAIALSGTGDLTLSGRSDTTDATKTFNQSAGKLTINNGGSLTLDTAASAINGTSEVVLGEATGNTAGTLIVNNGTANQAKIITAGTSTNSALTVQGADTSGATPVYTSLALADGSDIELGTVTVGDGTNANVLTMAGDTNGSKIAKAVTTIIYDKAKVDMTGSKADLTINTGDTWNGQINQTAGTLTVLNDDYTRSTGYLTSDGGKIIIGDIATPVPGTLIINNVLDSITAKTAVTINSNSLLDQSAGKVILNATGTAGTTDNWNGAIALSQKGDLTLTGFNKVTNGIVKYNQTGGKATLDNTNLELAYNATAANTSAITDGSVALTNGSTLTLSNRLATNNASVTMAGANETLNVKDGTTMTVDHYTYNDGVSPAQLIQTSISAGSVNIGNTADNTDHSTFAVSTGTIATAANVAINEGSALNITGKDAVNESAPGAGDAIVAAITLDGADVWNGDINLSNAGTAVDTNTSLTLTGVNKTTGVNPTFDNTGSSPYYSQTGGSLYMTNNTTLSMADSSLISGGNLTVDTNSTYNSLSNAFSVANLTNAGLINGINGGYENYAVSTGFYAGDALGDKQGDFTTDLYARSNTNKNYDKYGSDGATIYASDPSKYGILNVSDWTLNGDIYGYDAPIDSSIKMDHLFKGSVAAGHTIDFTSTNKEVFTPIGWYGLHSKGGGNYSFDLNRYNPGVFRGQVSTLAQYQNQLAIDDMIFNHTMVEQGFKGNDYIASNPNRLASANDLYPPYQYSRKDGGLWVKMYGNFERLHAGGLDVGNNAYGTIIGADFGLKELKHGWQFMPTAFIGYNGAHQHWEGYGAYQNGGQLGVMGTLYKNDFMIGAMAYGGVYGNKMSTPRGDDNAFNYFAGSAVKGAYNWKFAKNWALQPNLFLSYNHFGQQNWHSDFGQMGMMSGSLNGINIAPGLNLIYERETWSAYVTLQYMYNINQATGGRAGNVDLPSLSMDRGYIQYGIGVNKKFTDRFSGFLQAVVRNVGRNGIGFQAGFQWRLGKGSSGGKLKKTNVIPEPKKTEIILSGDKIQ